MNRTICDVRGRVNSNPALLGHFYTGDDRDLPAPQSVVEVAKELPAEDWCEVTWREGTKGPLTSRFCATRVQPSHGHAHGQATEPLQWLLVEWPSDQPEPTKFWLSTLSEETPLRELVSFAKIRWWVEQNYQQLKQEVALDHFEGRSWIGWHHHVTLAGMAFDFLVLEGFRRKTTSGWSLPHAKRELQRILIIRLGFCPLRRRRPWPDDT